MAMYGALISSQDRGLAVACAVLSYSSFSDARDHDSALEQERADHPASIAARRLARHPTASAAISVSRDASIAQTQPASGTMEARMEEAPVLVERRKGYRVVTLNRPRHLNAFTEAMHAHLKRALAEAEDDGDCRALLLTGAGRAFCTGQDLNERVGKDGKAVVHRSALVTYINSFIVQF